MAYIYDKHSNSFSPEAANNKVTINMETKRIIEGYFLYVCFSFTWKQQLS